MKRRSVTKKYQTDKHEARHRKLKENFNSCFVTTNYLDLTFYVLEVILLT